VEKPRADDARLSRRVVCGNPRLIVIQNAIHPEPETAPPDRTAAGTLVGRLGVRSIVLVGMMGAGKSSVGRRLAARLGLPFVDADNEIEAAAGMTIPDIFAKHGEPYFRTGEARVIARLLDGGPQVLATGGGAFMNAETRAAIAAKGVAVWLKAEAETLLRRIKRRGDRPLLMTDDPAATLRNLIEERYPVYADARFTVHSRDVPHEKIVDEIIEVLGDGIDSAGGVSPPQTSGKPSAMTVQPSPRAPTVVDVALGERAYDIVIGRDVLASLGARVAALRPGARVALVTDANVAGLHLGTARASLAAAGVDAVEVVVAPGEGSKSWRGIEQVCEAVIAGRIERRDLVIALGGGVIGDLAGFAAALVKRGVDYVQVPTTLLAQVDSSVGGKTAIDSPQGKNLIGSFHQPVLVLADTAALDTLPPEQFRAGYAEVVKYGLLGDAGFFDWLEANWQEVFAGGPAREHAIAVSCRAKAAIVARDERETGDRALLNLGHTFGHAFEAAAGFGGELLHGDAVALGMALAFEFSVRQGLCPAADMERAVAHLARTGLPVRVGDLAGEAPGVDLLMDLIAQDKKVKRGKLTFILVRALGDAFVADDVDPAAIRAFLTEKLAAR